MLCAEILFSLAHGLRGQTCMLMALYLRYSEACRPAVCALLPAQMYAYIEDAGCCLCPISKVLRQIVP